MTVKEFYEYCAERGIEDYDLRLEFKGGFVETFIPEENATISPPIYSIGIIYIHSAEMKY